MEPQVMIEKSVFNQSLAYAWAEFVDCPERMRTLAGFLVKHLTNYKNGVILDAALGIGCESIYLVKNGFRVVSNEIDDSLIKIALEAAKLNKVQLRILNHDWRDMNDQNWENHFDSIYLLGNSLCLLEEKEDIHLALKNFYNSIKKGGMFITDERNFPYILQNKEEILSGNFMYSGKYLYCGKSIKGIPIEIANDRVTFGYFRNSRLLGTLNMYPFKKDEIKNLLLETGFKTVMEFSDFQSGYYSQADFFTYIAIK